MVSPESAREAALRALVDIDERLSLIHIYLDGILFIDKARNIAEEQAEDEA